MFRHSKIISWSCVIVQIVPRLHMFVVSSVSLSRLISLFNCG